MFRYRCMVAALGLASLFGCIATPDGSLGFRRLRAMTDGDRLPPVESLRARLIGIEESSRSGPSPRRVAFRTVRLDPESGPAEPRLDPFQKTWHLNISVRTAGPKLGSTKQKLDRRLDLPLKLDVFDVFDDPATPLDRKSNLGLNTISLGFGRSESERLGWNVYGGFGLGAERNHDSFLVSTLDVNFQYAVYYAGFVAEYYPWAMPTGDAQMTWTERFSRARPYFVGGFELGFINAEADGDLTIASTTLYKDGETIRDWVFSVPVGVGWALPLSDRWSLQTVLDYRFHFYRPEEYSGWNLTTGLRWRL